MASLTGLALECRSSSRATTTCTSAGFPLAEDLTSRRHRLEDCLNALKEERRKIEAFQRELPLCMQLLHDAIESYKEKLAVCKPSTMKGRPHIQSSTSLNDQTGSSLLSPNERTGTDEFNSMKKAAGFPLGCNIEEELPQRSSCKPDWMALPAVCSSIQGESISLPQEKCQTNVGKTITHPRSHEQAFSTSSKPFFHSKNKSGGAFTPFSRDKQVVQPTPQTGRIDPADLSLSLKDQDAGSTRPSETSIPPHNLSKPKHEETRLKDSAVKGNNGQSDSPSARKVRRCWSPELHRRFVNALQQLGGSQVATPKQIRELMNVEGLTNDEVKSHLQKYRLHTRRSSPPQNSAPQTPQVVVLGGIWVPPEYTVHAGAQQGPSLYNSAQQPHVYQPASSQERCSDFGSVEQMHLQPSTLNGQKLAPAHSQSSPHGSSQLAGHSASVFHEPGRGESVCDDEGSNNSSCKGCPRGCQTHEASEMEDNRSQGDSISGFQSHCTSEDDDSHGGDTSLKMV